MSGATGSASALTVKTLRHIAWVQASNTNAFPCRSNSPFAITNASSPPDSLSHLAKNNNPPTFLEELTATGKFPQALSKRNLISWILARLTELSYGGLTFEDTAFESDGGEFGYRLKISDATSQRIGCWGFLFWDDRIELRGSAEPHAINGQTLIVEMLTESPRDLGKCEVTIRNPDARTKKTYGWNGYQYL
jgi:hypothetical protein